MLFRADSYHEAGNSHELFSDCDVSLSDQYSSVMDSAGQLSLGNKGLKSSFHELGKSETQYVIEFLF